MKYALIALLLTGCAYSPKQTMEQGPRSVHQLSLTPEKAALCMVRNIENNRPNIVPAYKATEGGEQEVLARAADYILAVAHVMPKGSGSEATVWLTPNPMLGKVGLTVAMIAGC